MTIKTPRRGIKRKKKAVFTQYLFRLLVLIGFLCVVVGMFWGLWYYASHCCSWFCLRTIEVNGTKHLKAKDVIAISGLTLFKDNLLRIDSKEISRRILSNSWVKDAEVEKEFPDKLIIKIKERNPVALLHVRTGYFLIDIDGHLITKTSPKFYKKLPILSMQTKDRYIAISNNSIANIAGCGLRFLRLSKKAKRFINTIYPILCLEDIKEIIIRPKTLVVYLRGGDVPIIFSKEYDLKKEFIHAQKVLCYLYRSGRYSQTLEIRLDYAPDKVWAKLKRS